MIIWRYFISLIYFKTYIYHIIYDLFHEKEDLCTLIIVCGIGNYLGGALSAMVTIMCTGIVVEREGDPLSAAFTISMYSDVEDRLSSLAREIVPKDGSIENTFPMFPRIGHLKLVLLKIQSLLYKGKSY